MLSSVVITGAIALLGAGVWRLSTTGSGESAAVPARSARATEGVSPAEGGRRSPGPDASLRTAAAVAAGAVGVTGGALAVTAVLYDPGVGLPAKGVALVGLLVGVTVVGSAASARLGVERPRRRPTAEHRRSLSAAFGEVAGRTFVDLRAAAVTARGGPVDDATLGVLAAATAGADLAALAEWGERAGVAGPEGIRERVEALSAADLVSIEGGRVRLDARVSEADAGRIASLAATAEG